MHVKPEGGASAAEGIERGRAFSGTVFHMIFLNFKGIVKYKL